jgi:hypothetical protein
MIKGWHIGIIVLIIVTYLVGVKFPSLGQGVLSKVGL